MVVKKTFRYSNVFFYNHLCRNSVIRNIIMESGINVSLHESSVRPISGTDNLFRYYQRSQAGKVPDPYNRRPGFLTRELNAI